MCMGLISGTQLKCGYVGKAQVIELCSSMFREALVKNPYTQILDDI
jgi:hypothetical protein